MCRIINAKDNGFEKALLAVILISYIHPFEDGNKRTGRMVSNALLVTEGVCPLSYRSVDSIDYKKPCFCSTNKIILLLLRKYSLNT
jgi:Fic family protein